MNRFNRRQFLNACIRGTLSCSVASMGVNLGLSTRLLAQSNQRFDDNKALVCIFLYGGNDSYNMLVPTGTSEYNTYANVRQNLAHSRDNLLAIEPVTPNQYAVGIPGQASALQQLFADKKLSIVTNIGPMVQPASKQQLLDNFDLLPPQLFSHNDQQDLWQSSTVDTSTSNGWGGRIADLIGDTNDPLPMSVTLFGNNLFQSGSLSQPLSVDEGGPEIFAALSREQFWNEARADVFDRIMQDVRQPLERAYQQQILRASTNNQRILTTLDVVDDTTVDYPENNPLSGQLQMVARLIAGQPVTGQPRQIYHVGMGGWDTHDNQANLHPQLLASLGDAMAAFQQDLENRGLGNQVTTFTLSEFGRTLTSNGDGTDHGWAGHQLIMGGAIKGGELFNTLPELTLNSNDDLDDGRMIPTLSVDKYGAALARWFGVSTSDLDLVFPNLNRFDPDALQLFS